MNKKIRKIITSIWVSFHEKKWKNRLKYIYEDNHSDKLMIIFSGFAAKPVYNYMRTLKGFKNISKLYILDDFGIRGSYYWFENGENRPQVLCESLITNILTGGGYKSLYTMGTSKGGTCAIYYGLKFHAAHIYSGACQYRVADYLNPPERQHILRAMMGETYTEFDYELLNNMVLNVLKENKGCKSVVHLLYSKSEHTYDDHIVFLLEDLKNNNIPYTEKIEDFTNHSDVGYFFIPYIKKELEII